MTKTRSAANFVKIITCTYNDNKTSRQDYNYMHRNQQ